MNLANSFWLECPQAAGWPGESAQSSQHLMVSLFSSGNHCKGGRILCRMGGSMKVALRLRNLQVRALAVVLAVTLAAPWSLLDAVTGAPELPNPGDVSVSKQDQEKLGLKVAGEVYQQMPILPDSDPVTQYVQQLGSRLEAVIPQQYNWPYQFHVV